jgi:hypothetical protein
MNTNEYLYNGHYIPQATITSIAGAASWQDLTPNQIQGISAAIYSGYPTTPNTTE